MRNLQWFRKQAMYASRSMWIGILFSLLSTISIILPRTLHSYVKKNTLTTRDIAERIQHNRTQLSEEMQRIWLGYSLGCTSDIPYLPLPEIDDILVFCYGIPVVPWLKRIGVHQWNNWLDHLGATLRARYPDREDILPGAPWQQWIREHVQFVETHFARSAGQRIAQVVHALPSEPGGVYLFGHSAGGAAVLEYLADLRDGLAPLPGRRIRAALTMNAAVSGLARAWSAWPVAPERPSRYDQVIPRMREYLVLNRSQLRRHRRITWAREYIHNPFHALGAWAKEQNMALVTVCNVADAFSHDALADIPYLRLQIGTRFDLQGIVTGKTHLSVQRDPRVPHFIWWHAKVTLADSL